MCQWVPIRCLWSPKFHSNSYFCRFRFGSVHYTAMVYVNGQHLVTHAGGHLPFEAEVTKNNILPNIFLVKVGPLLTFVDENRVTVAVNNTLSRWFHAPVIVFNKYSSSPSRSPSINHLYQHYLILSPVVRFTVPQGEVRWQPESPKWDFLVSICCQSYHIHGHDGQSKDRWRIFIFTLKHHLESWWPFCLLADTQLATPP